ncbi:hypothetical protein SAMN02745216_00161 [Desulfatibacillum alkenivorans DSM 16219]|uniref:Uncharacterized protein n=1 Tax=Desulfatibacillum alkenivorans DSM 16219 TaxID=1121393 RepID=A0A1M6C6T6_9BACT|nr:hypothetical protein [Desulfatibacillum alkenivorans]SHI56511.1 hypothetical protein SAMN02745216_00161 [Desulfatibacillum alkenivorans DSM 16219]
MKKLLNLLIVLLGCAILAAPVAITASAIGGGDSFVVSSNNAVITKVVAKVGGANASGVQDSDTQWTFDLDGAGAGTPVNLRVLAVADGAGEPSVSVTGDVDVTKGVCRDKSNRQRCNADILDGATDYCDCAGMTPSAGDKLVIRVMGEVAGAESDVPRDVF